MPVKKHFATALTKHISISAEGDILSYKISVVWGVCKHREGRGTRLGCSSRPLGMEAAAWADPWSWLWEQGQKGIFVLSKAQVSKTGASWDTYISLPSQNCQITFWGFRLFYQKCAAENLCWLWSLTLWRESGSPATAKAECPCPARAGMCSRSSINYPHTHQLLLFVSTWG